MSRIAAFIDGLQAFYGPLPSPPRDPFGFFVWEVLSVRSTPRKRDAAYAALKRLRALTPDALWRAPQRKLEESVALAGPYRDQRLDALKAGADRFRRSPRLSDEIRGPLPAARRALKRLPQLGRGGARRMLLFAADHPVMPVDAAVDRVARRLGYGESTGLSAAPSGSVRKALLSELGADVPALRRALLYLSIHAASTCTENDPHCAVCPLRHDCRYWRMKFQIED
jgi:endonuclease III